MTAAFEVGKSYINTETRNPTLWKCVYVWSSGYGLLVSQYDEVEESADPYYYQEYQAPRKIKRWMIWWKSGHVELQEYWPKTRTENMLAQKEIELTEGEGVDNSA